jgi:hypothetical protein
MIRNVKPVGSEGSRRLAVAWDEHVGIKSDASIIKGMENSLCAARLAQC